MSPSQSVSIESLIRQKCAEHLPVLAIETLQLVLPVKFKKSMKGVGRRVAGGGAAPASAAMGGASEERGKSKEAAGFLNAASRLFGPQLRTASQFLQQA